MKILMPVDGSQESNQAVDRLIGHLGWYQPPIELHLLNVQYPLHGDVSAFIAQERLREYHHDEGLKALQPARARLDAIKLPYQFHIGVGQPADVIVQYAHEKGCDQIVMGPRGLGSVSSLLLGSVTVKVLSLSKVPVLLLR